MAWNIQKKEENNKPKIVVGLNALNKIKMLCAEYPELEWIARLTGEFKLQDKEIYVNDIHLFEQECTATHTEFTAKGCEDLAKSNIKSIGWIHSHNNMQVFFSGEDVSTSKAHPVSIVVNNKMEMVAKVTFKNEVFKMSELVDAEVFIETDDSDEKIQDLLVKTLNKKFPGVVADISVTNIFKPDSKFIEHAKTLIQEPKPIITPHKNIGWGYWDWGSVKTAGHKICAYCDGIVGKKSVTDGMSGATYHKKCYQALKRDMLGYDHVSKPHYNEDYEDYDNYEEHYPYSV